MNLMCTADVTPVLVHTVEKDWGSHMDFRTMHKCRNFWDIHAWTLDHIVTELHP